MENLHELISLGNKYKITKNQHIIPIESIKRFTNDNNEVYIKNLLSKNKKTSSVNPKDSIFTVKRFWSEIDETGYMKLIEDNFQFFVDKIINNKLDKFNPKENKIIWKMYLLWRYRVEFFENSHKYLLTDNVDSDYTQIEKEQIESRGMAYDNDGDIPSRFIIGGQIQLCIMRDIEIYSNICWKVIISDDTNFIMPSNPYMNRKVIDKILINDKLYFPISSKVCLLPHNDFLADNDFVNNLNELMKKIVSGFIFGNNLKGKSLLSETREGVFEEGAYKCK